MCWPRVAHRFFGWGIVVLLPMPAQAHAGAGVGLGHVVEPQLDGAERGGRTGKKRRDEATKQRQPVRWRKRGPTSRQFEGENYREIFILTFWHNFWPRRPRGRANGRKEDFFQALACRGISAMMENRGKSKAFSTRSSAENKTTAKNTIWEDEMF